MLVFWYMWTNTVKPHLPRALAPHQNLSQLIVHLSVLSIEGLDLQQMQAAVSVLISLN